MAIAQVIRAHIDALCEDWVAHARRRAPAGAALDADDLRDGSRELLVALADDLDGSTAAPARSRVADCARVHAATRLSQGFTISCMAAEYSHLRTLLVALPAPAADGGREADLLAVGEAIDRAWAESIGYYEATLEHARDLFLGALGHDLRNPLSAITMSAHMLLRDEHLGAESTKAGVRIFNSAARMREMIDALLDFTRVRLGNRLPLERRRVDLDPVFRETIAELSAAHPTHELRYASDGELRGLWDLGRLAQVLSNLVGNAMEHGDPGLPVTVRAQGGGERMVVTVHNPGPPIPPDVLKQMFDPLQRAICDVGVRPHAKGHLGLGLFICHHIVEAHGGEMTAASSPEDGTTVTVALPVG